MIDIDGNSEIGEKVFRCDSVHLAGGSPSVSARKIFSLTSCLVLISDCEVRLRNLTILTSDNSSNGKCLHLENCERFEISDCVLVSSSPSTDLGPYPSR